MLETNYYIECLKISEPKEQAIITVKDSYGKPKLRLFPSREFAERWLNQQNSEGKLRAGWAHTIHETKILA